MRYLFFTIYKIWGNLLFIYETLWYFQNVFMDLINYIIVGSLTTRLLDPYLKYEVKSNRNEAKNIKFTSTYLEISKISIVLRQSLKFLQQAYNTVIY